MANPVDRDHIVEHLALDLDELYARLLGTQDSSELHSLRGRSARGKELFEKRLKLVRKTVCEKFNAQPSTVRNNIDLVALVVSALTGVPAVEGTPVIPFAVVLVKIGLDKICSKP